MQRPFTFTYTHDHEGKRSLRTTSPSTRCPSSTRLSGVTSLEVMQASRRERQQRQEYATQKLIEFDEKARIAEQAAIDAHRARIEAQAAQLELRLFEEAVKTLKRETPPKKKRKVKKKNK